MSHHVEIHCEESEPESFWIGVSAVVTVGLLLSVLIGSIFYFHSTVSQERDVKESTPISLELQRLRLYESEELSGVHWIDKDKKTVKISIDMAMNNVIATYKTK